MNDDDIVVMFDVIDDPDSSPESGLELDPEDVEQLPLDPDEEESDLVSSGDVYFFSDPDIPIIVEKLDQISLILAALLFFTVFVWVEARIKNAVKKVMHND